MKKMGISVSAMTTAATGPTLIRKSLKVSLAAEPIMMLGGSPIRVEVPPILEEKITENR